MEFRKLSKEEVGVFKQWAHDNYTPGTTIPEELWHPVTVEECQKMNLNSKTEEITYDFCFNVKVPEGTDAGAEAMREAIACRLRALDDDELLEACGEVERVPYES